MQAAESVSLIQQVSLELCISKAAQWRRLLVASDALELGHLIWTFSHHSTVTDEPEAETVAMSSSTPAVSVDHSLTAHAEVAFNYT